MFCKQCGNKLPEDAGFCNNCGAKQDLPAPAGQPEAQARNEQGTYNSPGGNYAPPYSPRNPQVFPQPYISGIPPKKNTMKIVLISLAGIVVILSVVLMLLLGKSGSGNNADEILHVSPYVDMEALAGWEKDTFSLSEVGSTSQEDYDHPNGDIMDQNAQGPYLDAGQAASDNTPDNTHAGTGEWRAFETPAWSREPIYNVLTNGVWTSVGLATNPNQENGESGVFYLDDFEGTLYHVTFFGNQTCEIEYYEDTNGVNTYAYEIMDTAYCDTFTDEDGLGYRFYYGDDGRIYMCGYYDIGDGTYPDISDFVVFELQGEPAA